ncbi:MAG: sigma-70 family RNA polymerase sigma factor [Actinomycetota bacterium]|nr:sigma-70 family RNA polymerase sigma factor [Actinomycetota bacterium]
MDHSPESVSFESAWKDIAPRLLGMLRRRGAAHDVADDLVQETAIKLFEAWDRVDPDRPLWPLARTIAVNSFTDRIRRDRSRPVDDIPDQPLNYDLEDHVLARGRLRSVGSAMSGLRPADRELLLKEVTAPTRGASSQLEMARLRARRKLERALQDVASAFGAVQVAARRICGLELSRWLPDAQPVAPIAVGLVAILGVTGPAMPASSTPDMHRALRSAHVRLAAEYESHGHRSSAHHHIGDRNRATSAAGSDRAIASTSPRVQPTSPSPTPSPRESTVASAGDASAKTKEGQGYKSAGVCVQNGDSGDDHGTTVTVYDGSQKEGEDPDPCS